uniref:Uncharacterized protein n=1 Tax=Rhizophora mucronata TaxID=61149 RepID=A0A2P2J2U8_RHIMU
MSLTSIEIHSNLHQEEYIGKADSDTEPVEIMQEKKATVDVDTLNS